MYKLIWFASLSLLLCICGTSSAQDSNLVEVVTVEVRPGSEAKFEEFIQAFREASEEQGLENYWLTAQSVSGAPTYTFNLARPGGWGSMADSDPDLAEAFGESEAARLWQLAEDSIAEFGRAFYQTQMDMSNPYPGEEMGAPDAVVYTHISINPGMAQQFAEVSRKTTEASLALYPDAYYATQTPGLGASAVRVVGVVPSWSDLDSPLPPPPQRNIEHYGPAEGGRLNDLADMAISSIETVVHRTRPDLNYQPQN